eukprot:925517-Ditylum_brightwellii.AAC.1
MEVENPSNNYNPSTNPIRTQKRPAIAIEIETTTPSKAAGMLKSNTASTHTETANTTLDSTNL